MTDTTPRAPKARYLFFAFPLAVAVGSGLVITARALEARPADGALLAALDPGESFTKSCGDVDTDALFRSLFAYAPGDSATSASVRFQRRGSEARLEVVEEDLPDDAVAAQRTRYALVHEGGVWRVTGCEREALRCWRGAPTRGVCP